MAAPILKARAASFVDDDGVERMYTTGPLPDDTPKAHLDALREQGAIAEGDEPTALDVTNAGPVGPADADAPGHVDPDPDLPAPPSDPTHETSELYAGAETGQPPGNTDQPAAVSSSSSTSRSEPSADLPDDAPDASQEDVGTLAKYIDEQSLNAPQTVALAEGDPELAAKVIEAEQAAHGGDARVTVTRPLDKLAAKGTGGGESPTSPAA